MGLESMVKKFVITTAQYNAKANYQLLDSIETYCSMNDAQLLILPTVGKSILEENVLDEMLQNYSIIDRQLGLLNTLTIKDFGVRPQQINPLTGLERFAQGDRSYILPGTKQVLKFVSNNNTKLPKAIMTTGAITHPYYNLKFRTGQIAQHDHRYGFVVVEKMNNTYFHFRHVPAMKNGKFVDNGVLYNGQSDPQVIRPKAMVMGDLHPYDLNLAHKKASLNQIRWLNPENLFLHDAFNGYSISHHYKNNAFQARTAFNKQGLSLEEEFKHTGKVIRELASEVDGVVYIVKSNHDEHLDRYLDEGRFVGDKGNDVLGAQLYAARMSGEDALEVGLAPYLAGVSNVVFLSRDVDVKMAGFQLANHGDLGANGGRGSVTSIERANGKSITGHTHSALIVRDTYKVGTATDLRLSYNRGYSNWTNTNGFLYEGGLVQLVNTINGRWRLKQ